MIYLTNNTPNQIKYWLGEKYYESYPIEFSQVEQYTTINGELDINLKWAPRTYILQVSKLPSKSIKLGSAKHNTTYLCVENSIPKKWLKDSNILTLSPKDFIPKEYIAIKDIVDTRLYKELLRLYVQDPYLLKEECIKLILSYTGEVIKFKDYLEGGLSTLNLKAIFSNIGVRPIKHLVQAIDKSTLWNCFMGSKDAAPLIKQYIPNNLYCTILWLQLAVDNSYLSLEDAAIIWASYMDESIGKSIDIDTYNQLKRQYGI